MSMKDSLLKLRNFFTIDNKDESEVLDIDNKNGELVDEKAQFNGVCVNDLVEEGETVLNDCIDDILDKLVLDFFPKDGKWYSNCFRNSYEFSMDNLPCHLRDTKWLSLMFRTNQKLFMFTPEYIQNYIKRSYVFNEARHNYELEIVKWQINYMALGGEGWIIDDELGGDFFLFSTTADLAFRKGIVDTLTKIGMDIEVIEEGIEKNAYLWRDCYMDRAFSNEFDSILFDANFLLDGKKDEYISLNKPVLVDVDLDFKNAWLQLRRYEYYQNHKTSVDKYGVVLPEMMLGAEEVIDLKKFVLKKAQERRNDIESYSIQKKEFNNKKYLKKI